MTFLDGQICTNVSEEPGTVAWLEENRKSRKYCCRPKKTADI